MLKTVLASVLLSLVYCYQKPLRSVIQLYLCSSSSSEHSYRDGGTREAMKFLNSKAGSKLLSSLVADNPSVREKSSKQTFWFTETFSVDSMRCEGLQPSGILVNLTCSDHGKTEYMQISAPFHTEVRNENELKNALLMLALKYGRLQDTGEIVQLSFGENHTLPANLRFNDVPHAPWVRRFVYEAATFAVLRAVENTFIINKSRLQIKVNYPEVNPAFDTYRMAIVLEMVRSIALALMQDTVPKRVRICVQQSLGEGIFVGQPIALSSMRQVLERMDWGTLLTPGERFQIQDNTSPRQEALLRFGAVGPNQVAPDDDVIIVISPQNVQGGMITDLLEGMVQAAGGRPLILLNPQLADRPSGNNLMQIRGRAERRAFADSFQDIFCLRLLYPSSGGYMYPIRGMLVKRTFDSPWVAYQKEDAEGNDGDRIQEVYTPVAAFDPYSPPDPTLLSSVFF